MELFSVMSLAGRGDAICARDELWTCATCLQFDTTRCGERRRSETCMFCLACRISSQCRRTARNNCMGSDHNRCMELSVAQMGARFLFELVSYAWSWQFTMANIFAAEYLECNQCQPMSWTMKDCPSRGCLIHLLQRRCLQRRANTDHDCKT